MDVINLPKAIEFVMSCCNADGGFGSKPNAESHAGLIYCCVGFLSITKQLHRIDTEKLCWWLCERQLPSGGLNGRPEKLPDVCYSWWVLSSLTIMGRLHWISSEKLEQFILSCQVSALRNHFISLAILIQSGQVIGSSSHSPICIQELISNSLRTAAELVNLSPNFLTLFSVSGQ